MISTDRAPGRGWYRHLQQNSEQFSQMVHEVRGHLFTDHPGMGLLDVYAAMLPTLRFEPALHVNYAETVLRIHDGRPKMKDWPKGMGGSRTVLPE